MNEDLSSCGTIIGVKDIPIPLLLPNKTYLYFSHCHKGQPGGQAALDVTIERNIRLIDYEVITDIADKRLVFFGLYAGYAGAINGLTA